MGLFSPKDFNISDAEAMQNALPRFGIQGFFATLSDYLPHLLKTNLLTCCCILPAIALFFVGRLLTDNVFVAGLFPLLGAPLVGAGLCALNGIVCESIRNRGYAFWETYKKHFRENTRASILPAVLYILSVEITLYSVWLGGLDIDLGAFGGNRLVLCILTAFIRTLLSYMLPMITLLELPVKHYFRNSLLMILAQLKATFCIMVIPSILFFATMFLTPFSVLHILTFGFALHTLCAQMWAWPALNRTLRIEEREIEKKNSCI